MSEETSKQPYRDASLGVEERVADLLGRMTLEEKIAQLGAVWAAAIIHEDRFSAEKAKDHLARGAGQLTRIGASTVLRPEQSAAVLNDVQRWLLENTRLGIPTILHEESCAGFLARDATQFPQAIGLASSWDLELVEQVGDVIRRQMLAVGARQTLAPVLDIARDPRGGRAEETFGEDPYLVARMGVAYVRGVQGESLADGVAATGKHFMGYGASEGGLNWAPSLLPRRELLERILPPFAAAIREAGLASLMNGYQESDGIPCGASKWLLDDLLRGELGFEGLVVADYFTVICLMTYHRLAADKSEAGARCLEAGLDVELPTVDCYGDPLREAIERGRVDEGLVDRSVARVLRLKFQLGLFERPYVDAENAGAVFETPEQRALARRAARESVVLLKNEGELLPLDPGIGKLAVIGPSADSRRLLQGDYSYPTHVEIVFGPIHEGAGAAAGDASSDASLAPSKRGADLDLADCFTETISLLEGIRAAVSDATEVVHVQGCELQGDSREGFVDAVAAARAAEVAVVVVGGKSGLVRGCSSGEFNDRADLGLTGVQTELIRAVVSTGTPTVVVLVNGRPRALSDFFDDVPAVLEAWLPGEEGGHGVADVIFGAVSPSGRLPVTLPRAVGQLPLYYNHKPSGARSQMHGDYSDLSCSPLLPFGHGLSYTSFEYSGLELSSRRPHADEKLEVSLRVDNVGDRSGTEVVQLYVNDVVASVTRPVKELKGFARVTLEPGRGAIVRFELDLGQLGFYDRDMQFVVEPGEVRIMLGSSSEDVRLEETVVMEPVEGGRGVDAGVRKLRPADVAPTAVEVRPA